MLPPWNHEKISFGHAFFILMQLRICCSVQNFQTGKSKKLEIENAEKLIAKAENLRTLIRESSCKPSPDCENALRALGLESPKVNVSFDDVAGLEQVKNEIRTKVIYPLLYPEEAKKYGVRAGGGLLLYGPPGTGKTFIAKAIASEVNAQFILCESSKLKDQWFGNFEKNIHKLFEAAKICAPSILFIDEIDDMAPKRSTSPSSVMKRAVAELLNCMDGMKSHSKPILIIGATNVPWDLDEAILRPGRFDELIYVPPPDLPAREQIFKLNLKKVPHDELDFAYLASITDGYSGADIAYICRKAGEFVFRDAIENGIQRNLSMTDITRAISEKPPSISKQYIARYIAFTKSNVKT